MPDGVDFLKAPLPEQTSDTSAVQSVLSGRRANGSGASRVYQFLKGWPLATAALAACWALFFNELHGEWDVNAQYSYGYVVPLLGAVLIWRRWPERPAPLPGNAGPAALIGFALLSLLLPLALVREANPEWRMLYWGHGFLVLALSFCLLYRAGGWRWVKFFAPPLAFMLIAVPWPMEWEQSLIQNLMRFVAALTVQVAGWLGVPAVQHGNLIEVAAGVVGINEACSGIRSLQSGLMLSLFLGEMYRFSAARRAVLVGASLVFVLAANVGRTTFLTWAAASRGLAQMHAWHDSAGLFVMLFVLPCLFALAHWIKPNILPPVPGLNASALVPALPRWVAISVFAWIGLSEGLTEMWYRSHEHNLVPSPRWSVAWPAQESRFQKTALPQESLAILRCSQSASAAWKDEDDNQWSAFFLRWNAGRNSVQLAKGHRPDICLPAAGAKLVETYGYVVADSNGLALPFKYQTFQAGEQLMHVFYCLWSDCESASGQSQLGANPFKWRLGAVLRGERNLGQQVLEVVVTGPETSEAAVALFKRELPHLIQRQ